MEHDEYMEWLVRWDIIKVVKKGEVQKARELLEKYAGSKVLRKNCTTVYDAMEIQLLLYESVSAEPSTVDAMHRQALSECLERAVKLTERVWRIPRFIKEWLPLEQTMSDTETSYKNGYNYMRNYVRSR